MIETAAGGGESEDPVRSALPGGITLFNQARFWEAHEAWETGWLRATGGGKLFLQGLIQLAAAYHHVQRGTFRGGARLFKAALEKLERFPPGYLGVDRAETVEHAFSHRLRIEKSEQIDPDDYPKIRYN